ncbi:hypothetical protein [Antribacter gilvus]|uniref:hypothetical protein n=1 Tax=Antribacter gilvus TaxID=2304675 RepID=UPI000F7B31D6|nr:hypothetical protein [Antribacter gilvus]
MSIEVRGVDFFGEDRLLFASDESVTEEHLELIRRRGATMIELRGAATRGRDPGRLRFLADVPGLISVDLFDSGAARLPPELLPALESLGLFGRCTTVVEPATVPRLRVFGGPADRLGEGRFGPALWRLILTRWSGKTLARIPMGDGLDSIEVRGIGQCIDIGLPEAPVLRSIEIADVEIGSLEGLERLPLLEHVGIHPRFNSDVATLRHIDLSPLEHSRRLQWLVVGLQGYLDNMQAIAAHPDLMQVMGYESFFPEEYRDAPWAAVLEDRAAVRELIRAGRA